MQWLSPQFLWLLPIAIMAGIATLSMRRQAGRVALVALTRTLAITLLILALARPMFVRQGPPSVQVTVIDFSRSVPDAEIRRAWRDVQQQRALESRGFVHVVGFASRLEPLDDVRSLDDPTLASIRARLATPLLSTDPTDGGSALADAISLAGALAESAGASTVNVYTDGLPTRGDAVAQAMRLSQRGISVTARAMSPQAAPPLRIVSATASGGSVGETARGEAVVHAERAQDIEYELVTDGRTLAGPFKQSVEAGATRFPLPVALAHDGLNRFEIRVRSESGSETRSPIAAWATPPKQVIVVQQAGDVRASSALARLLGPSASIQSIMPAELDDAMLSKADLLVLASVPAASVSETTQSVIRTRVENGMGLLVTGGPSAFGPGGWSEAPLATILPARLPQELERQDPSASAVFIIDTSGSMTGPRINLAKEVVRLALRRLQPQDKAGIVEFYGSKRWAAPIQSAGNHLDLNRALNRLTAGGGTVILPAIEEAEFSLKNVNTRTRHVVILTDGGVESGPFETVTRRMSEAGITVSTVLVGPGGQSPFLASIAQWGRGRFYHAPDRFNLPEVILHQPQTNAPPPVVQAASKLSAQIDSDITRGLAFDSAPAINGYVRTQAKPTADALVRVGSDTLLAKWTWGRGHVATLSTDLGSTWAGTFGNWPGTATLVSNLCRSLYATPDASALQVQTVQRAAGIEVQIDAPTGSPSLSTAALRLDVLSTTGEVARTLTLEPVAARKWNTLLPNLDAGTWLLKAQTLDGASVAQAAFTIEPIPELQRSDADTELLKQLTRPASTKPPFTGRPVCVELWPWLAALAGVFWLSSILLRRLRVAVSARLSPKIATLAALCIFLAHGSNAHGQTTAPSTQPAADAIDAADLPSAEHLLREYLDRRPTDAWALSSLATVREIAGDDDASRDLLLRAVAAVPDNSSLRLRLRVLQQETATTQLTKNAVVSTSDAAEGLIAAMYGRFDLVTQRTRKPGESNDPFELLLRGNSLLRTNDPLAARDCFAAALNLKLTPRDRRFVLERLIAASRQAGKLGELADGWLNDPTLPPEQLLPLLSVLREQNRIDDVLAIWRKHVDDPAARELVTSDRFVTELIAAARQANRIADAEAICRAARDAEPGNDRWLAVLAKLLVEQNRVDDSSALLRETAAASPNAGRVMRLATIAFQLGSDELAMELARSSVAKEAGSAVTAELFCADIERHRGNRAEWRATLDRVAHLAGDDPKSIVRVAEAFESADDLPRAIALYRRASTGGEDVLQKLAWLLEQDNQLVEAQQIWLKLWREAGSTARRHEAQNRLLDLASRTGTIADLAADLEDRLTANTATGDDLALLIDIYVGARDPASASEILSSYKHLAGGEVEATRQLSQLYLKCGRFGQADRTLRQLLALDPDHAIDTLQEIAVLGIERSRPADAQAALEEISRRVGADLSTAELRAGVYEQLGQFAEAANEYHRAIIANSNQVEDWVLWAGAMNQAGQKEQAVKRLLLLAASADGDDLFAIAVDGLLNIEAPNDALKLARRYAIARVAADGKRLVLYELIRDLSETLGDPAMSLRAGELSLLVAGEQRTELIREMISLSKSTGQSERSIELGGTLLALGDQVPPQVFLDIGKQLLAQKRIAEADRAFTRAVEVSGDDETRRQVAKVYEAAGEMRLAVDALTPLLRLNSNDLELCSRLAGMYEQLGDQSNAFDRYLMALKLMSQRGLTSAVAATEPGEKKKPAPRQQTSLTESDQFLEGVVQGLINCTRTDTQATKLVEEIAAIARSELGTAPDGDRVPASVIQRCDLLRRIAFSVHRPDAADQFDLDVHARYPKDATFTRAGVAARARWGLTARGEQLAGEWKLKPHGESIDDSPLLREPPSSVDPDEAAQIVPVLLLRGDLDRARALLAATERRVPRGGESIDLIVSSALALDDTATADAFAGLLLTQLEGRTTPSAAEANKCVLRTWAALSKSGRHSLFGRLSQWIDRVKPDEKPAVALLCLRMAVDLDEPDAERLRLAQIVLQAAPSGGTVLDEVLNAVEPAERPALLAAAVQSTPSDQLRGLLLQLLAVRETPIDGALQDELIAALTAAPASDANESRDALAAYGWGRNTAQLPAIRRVLDAIGKTLGEKPADRMALAAAIDTTGDRAAADKLVGDVVLDLANSAKRAKTDSRTLGLAVDAMSPAGAHALLATLPDPATCTPPQQAARALLLERGGDSARALDELRAAFKRNPTDADLRRLLTDLLEASQRYAELLDTFVPLAGNDAIVDAPQKFRLLRAYRQLRRFDEAAALRSGDEGPLQQLQRLQLAAEAHEMDRILPYLRSFHVSNRWERRSFVPFLVPVGGVGGLTAELAKSPDALVSRIGIYDVIAREPWADDELQALLNVCEPDSRDVAPLTTALASGVADPATRGRVVSRLEAWAKANALNAKDLELVTALLRAGAPLPDSLMALARDTSARLTPAADTQTLSNWSRAWFTAGDANRATAINRWLIATRLTHLREDPPNIRLPAADALWKAQPQLLNASGGNPATPNVTEDEEQRLSRLAAVDTAEAERQLETLLRHGRVRLRSSSTFATLRARFAAERADMATYRERVSTAIDVAHSTGSTHDVLDVPAMLPQKSASARDAASIVREAILARLERSPTDRAIAVRSLCLLGSWTANHDLPQEANTCLAEATQHVGDEVEPQLWVADLARVIGKRDQANAIERRLLEARTLPPERVVPLLNALTDSVAAAELDRLRGIAANYCRIAEAGSAQK